ncbi:MAG TPA: ABC transporter substrate-binding protein [Trueperaceae bacterium]|nr:ABC transporter substrate-binding protein [Trueperaceae bacterium]
MRRILLLLALLLAPLASAQSLTTAMGSNPPTLDPQKTFNGFSFAVTTHIYETLFTVTTDGEIVGLLAEGWEFLEPSRLRVTLHDGVSFSNGEPLDAAAVKASLERLLAPETAAPGRFVVSAIDAVEVVDDLTLEIVTGEAFAPLLAHLAHPVTAIVPAALGDSLARQPVGSGPYVLESWTQSDSLVLSANQDYWGGAPAIPEVVYRVIPEVSTQVVELRSGGLDVLYNIPSDNFRQLREDQGLVTSSFLGWGSVHVGFNVGNPKLQDVRVRQAIAQAIDKQLIVDEFLGGLAEVGVAPIPPTVRFAASDLPEPYPYDPERARELLAEAGAEGVSLTIDVFQNPDLEAVAQVLQAMLADVGVNLEVRVQEYAAYAETVQQDSVELYGTTWGTVTLDADYTLYAFFHSSEIPANNVSRYSVPEVDSALEAARATPDDAQRADLYRSVQEQVLADVPMVTLYYPLSTAAKQPGLEGEVVRFSWINLDLRQATLQE